MATRQAATATQLGETYTVIGPGIRVNGRVQGEEDLHVEGWVEGSIELSETLHVSPQGIVVAEVRARDVVVSGVVVGNVTAADSVTLNPGAKLKGDISAPRVIIADGAAFSGNVAMGGEAPPARERRSAARARPASTPRAAARPAAARPAAPARAASATPTPAAARVAAIPRPAVAPADDEVTVVVRHAEIGQDEAASKESEAPRRKAGVKKKAKKAPPRARVPKPGKRRVSRRS